MPLDPIRSTSSNNLDETAKQTWLEPTSSKRESESQESSELEGKILTYFLVGSQIRNAAQQMGKIPPDTESYTQDQDSNSGNTNLSSSDINSLFLGWWVLEGLHSI